MTEQIPSYIENRSITVVKALMS